MAKFTLDPRLARDTHLLTRLGLCQLLLMRDCRWPWVVLVPQRDGIVEIFDMTPLDQTMLTFETAITARALKQASGCDKINIGALGNKVAQFHLHIVARRQDDSAWPGPVWGHGEAAAWDDSDRAAFTERLLEAL